ncbi:MAG: glycosyltransferase family 4 protein [Patescibacteria group bacterium]
MKVLLITNNTNSQSGWGRAFKGIESGLTSHGISCITLSEDAVDENHRLPKLVGVFSFFKSLRCVYKRAREVDVIHALDIWPYGVYAFFVSMFIHKPYFINAVGTYSIAPFFHIYKRPLVEFTSKHATHIFAISHYIKNRLVEKTGLQNISVVYLGANDLPIPSEIEISEMFKKYPRLVKKDPIVLTVGAIKDRKGQYETVQAIKILKDRYPGIFYVLVGSDTDSAYVIKIKSYIKEKGLEDSVCIVTDASTDKDLSLWYSVSDLFVLASKNESNHVEGFGLVIIEAGQFGLPSVGSYGSGCEDAIIDGQTGLLALPGDVNDLSKKMLAVLDERVTGKFSDNAQRYAQTFSWNKTTSAYIVYYKNVTKFKIK